VVALLLPLLALAAGGTPGFRVPFFGASRAPDDPVILATLAGHALVLLVAAAALWRMKRLGFWLTLLLGWIGLAAHLAGHWPWWEAHRSAPEGGRLLALEALLLAVQDLLFATLLTLITVYLIRRRGLFRP
jgi:hypothetical protein